MHGMGDFANNPMGMIPLRKLIAQAGYTWQEYQDHLYKSMALLSFFKALPPETANAYVHSVELCSSPSKLSGCSQEDACCIAMCRCSPDNTFHLRSRIVGLGSCGRYKGVSPARGASL